MSNESVIMQLSNGLADAAERGGASTVLVDARSRIPASGIALSAELVLTADHVVERDDEIKVVLADGSALSAELVGRDPNTDLALLRVSGGALTAAVRAEEPKVGQIVLALGRPTTGGIEASLGVVSAVGGPVRMGRGGQLERYIRTDTIPYPGFSGGPLVDVAGRVLGLNTSGLAGRTAITLPIGLAATVADSLAQHGRVRRGYLGVRTKPVRLPQAQQQALGRTQEHGLLLLWLEEGGPAEQGGLLIGDILVAVAGQPLSDPDELQRALVGSVVGQATDIEVLRGGQPATISVVVGAR